MTEPADVISNACAAIAQNALDQAAEVLASGYPFAPLANAGRRYSATDSMRVFMRDGFVDRYTGRRLIFPGTLRLLSQFLPDQFPFHNNWKTDVCHFGYYELFPTIDHLVPVSRGGADSAENWVSTSMLKNAAKANFTLEELGWSLHQPGDLTQWDGLTGWFMDQISKAPSSAQSSYVRQWALAARRAGFG
jgi:hypothetical protein